MTYQDQRGFTRTTMPRSLDREAELMARPRPLISRPLHRGSGFTYIEIVVYIGLIALFLKGLVLFHSSVAILSVRSRVSQEVTANVELAGKRLSYEIRSASGINTMTSTSLCLSSSDPSRNPTYLYVTGNRLRIGWGGGSTTCSNLTYDYPLTSNRVTISGFNFQNLSNTVTKHIQYSFIVAFASSSQRKEWTRSEVASGSAEIRSF